MLLRQPGQAGWPRGRLATETARQGGQGDVLLLRQPGRVARGTSLLLRQPDRVARGTSCY